jgi:hypothetical protein
VTTQHLNDKCLGKFAAFCKTFLGQMSGPGGYVW